MAYTALYRKFRPSEFESVKGQEHIVTTLKNQIKADRIGHAYLFCGTRGTGKTTVAKIFAKAVNCENPVDGSPCGECAMCKAISQGSSMNVIEMDAASNNSVNDIREIVDEVSFSPAEGKFKVYIIDEVHMLSTGAFNALLKTLEEPPSYVIFILATTEPHKLPITILSRCQRYDFHRITIDTIAERLQELMQIEGVTVEDRAIRYVARAGDGSMRDALSLLDQCIAFNLGEDLTYDMVLDVLGATDNAVFDRMFHAVYERDALKAIQILEEIVRQGRDLVQFVQDFIWYLRNLMILKNVDHVSEVEDIIDASTDTLKQLKETADAAEMNTITRYIRLFSELSGNIRYATQKRVLVEVALIKLCRPAMERDLSSLRDQIRALEDRVEQGIIVTDASQLQGAGVVGDASSGKANGDNKRNKPVLDHALPEEIEKIIKEKRKVAEGMEQPAKTYFLNASLSLGEGNTLIIALSNGADYMTGSPERVEHVESVLAEYTGKQVPVKIVEIKDERDFRNNYVDIEEILASAIDMDIEEDD